MSMKVARPIGAGRVGEEPEKIFHTGWRVMLRLDGLRGGWIGGPITTPGLTAEMEKGGFNWRLVVRLI